MKVLFVNKFLYPCGGAEGYMFKLGNYLEQIGHQVEYFGMEDERNIVGNKAGDYTSNMDFRNNSKLSKITYPFKIIYSREARKKIANVIEKFKPDIVHMNNINFQLTPSIIYEIKKYNIPIVQTVHDPQISCPNHRLYIEQKREICKECLDGRYSNCIKHKCFQNSLAKSVIGAMESYYYHKRNTYNLVDKYICPSEFIKGIILKGGVESNRICVQYNFSDDIKVEENVKKEPYAIYFGRLSIEKGIQTLVSVCKDLPEVKFVVAGTGPLENEVKSVDNIEYVGFKTGKELEELVEKALFSIYPSEWYENCPLSVIESQTMGTPVIGSDYGGTKELIKHEKTGLIFEGGNKTELKDAILKLWSNEELLKSMSEICLQKKENVVDVYTKKLLEIYKSLL